MHMRSRETIHLYTQRLNQKDRSLLKKKRKAHRGKYFTRRLHNRSKFTNLMGNSGISLSWSPVLFQGSFVGLGVVCQYVENLLLIHPLSLELISFHPLNLTKKMVLFQIRRMAFLKVKCVFVVVFGETAGWFSCSLLVLLLDSTTRWC